MGFFDKVGNAAHNAVTKTSDLVEIQKLKSAINGENKKIEGLQLELGIYIWGRYAAEKSDLFDHTAVDLCEKIQERYQAIDELNGQIKRIKLDRAQEANQTSVCSHCGETIPADFAFCTNCGTKLEDQHAEVLEEENATPIRYCQSCNAQLRENSRFCGSCGAKQDPDE